MCWDLCRCLVLDAAVAVHVARVLFDGSLGDEGRELRVARHLHAATHSLSWRRGETKIKHVGLLRRSRGASCPGGEAAEPLMLA